MTEQELQEAYDAATAAILAALDAAHIAMVDLKNVQKEIYSQAVALGMVDPNNPRADGPGKNQAKRIEAAVIVPVQSVASIHDHIKSARTLLIGTSPNLGALEDAGITVYDWQSEFNGTLPVTR